MDMTTSAVMMREVRLQIEKTKTEVLFDQTSPLCTYPSAGWVQKILRLAANVTSALLVS